MRRIRLLLSTCALLAAGPAPPVRFRDAADRAGLRFVLENSATPEKRMIETMIGGVAAFDYNQDGRTDIFFTNGAAIPSMRKESPKYWNRLYRNEGGMKFTDVTREAGLAGEGYSMGAAAADFDNDGLVDLFVAGVGGSRLYRNLGNGKFEDVTAKAGIHDDQWAVAAGWLDFDNDGRLDLWIVHYAQWPPASDRFCGDSEKRIRIYCHPKYFQGLPNRLYRNLGGGKFEDVSEASGVGRHAGRGMSVAFADYDGDGFIDAFVTNDNEPNFLFRNLGNGKFEETGLAAGVALLDSGKPVASMGADFRDYDNDGWPDVSVTALFGETYPLFRNTGKGGFRDATYASRVGRASARISGWGNGLFDFNLDGWKDLFTANSHVNDLVEQFEPTRYRLANSIFLNENGSFRDGTAEAGQGFQAARAHRGAAFADFNGDGKIDVVVSALGEAAELWENISETDGEWLIVKLEGVWSNRDGIGARLRWGNQWNVMTSAVGYASSSHFGVHFGAPKGQAPDRLEIWWPGGKKQTVAGVKARRIVVVRQQEEDR
ncbi:MAG: CRTAC1 family protein [Candidatus Solibacter usitatus]|nr:CRTAC1 family protein [Candidatus Solibacter usitatus]